MSKEFLFFIVFGLTTVLHFLSLYLQSKYKVYTGRFGKLGFWIHFIVTGGLWGFTAWIFPFNSQYLLVSFPRPLLGYLGFFIKGLGFAVILWAGILLGIKKMWGIRYFDKAYEEKIEKEGPYKVMKNPIYNGFIFCFIGEALTSGSLFYLLAALESFLLLNIFLASFENKEIKI